MVKITQNKLALLNVIILALVAGCTKKKTEETNIEDNPKFYASAEHEVKKTTIKSATPKAADKSLAKPVVRKWRKKTAAAKPNLVTKEAVAKDIPTVRVIVEDANKPVQQPSVQEPVKDVTINPVAPVQTTAPAPATQAPSAPSTPAQAPTVATPEVKPQTVVASDTTTPASPIIETKPAVIQNEMPA